jgi:2-polyprenyl-3-methyl-5-hydroxy-6-metoxy-1,4-benzoquinol methylase
LEKFTTTGLDEQQALLDKVSASYRRSSRQDDLLRQYFVKAIEPWIPVAGCGLEIGCSDGQMTQMLAERLRHLTVVEASERFVGEVQLRQIGNAVVHHCMFENFVPTNSYDCIFATWVLTHMIDVQAVLKHVKGMLSDNGLLFVSVPNVRVLSRQLACHMGLLDELYGLTPNDLAHGHLRAYDRQRLNSELDKAGFEVVTQGGLMMKFLADFQMDQLYESEILTAAHADGLYSLGKEYPDLTAAIYSVCKARP